MKRRDVLRYGRTGLLAACGLGVAANWKPSHAAEPTLTIQWLGHTCFLFVGSGKRLVVNPFDPVGCTAGYRAPNVKADIVMISSRLLDEGAVEVLPGNPRVLFQAGAYQIDQLTIQGVLSERSRSTPEAGYRFSPNVAWQWKQSGMNIVHLGGATTPITVEQKILFGRPDVLVLPVGGNGTERGLKAYTPQEAQEAVRTLNPKMVIPTYYQTPAADPKTCQIESVDKFLGLMAGAQVRRLPQDTLTLKASGLSASNLVIQVPTYGFSKPPSKPPKPSASLPVLIA